ncbi:hypothetical protein NBRC116592_23340 [Colwellia sp. KU-HH00111]|uniref:type II secretion system protein GspG n=1 Tax=Colwellia sp. KU-HH00111 TaxID=3127652 RepID=UPI003104C226
MNIPTINVFKLVSVLLVILTLIYLPSIKVNKVQLKHTLINTELKSINTVVVRRLREIESDLSYVEKINLILQNEFDDFREIPLDPWLKPYIVKLSGNKVYIGSYGQDAIKGGKSNNKDIFMLIKKINEKE